MEPQQDLLFLSRLFQKAASKPTELYVLTRLWHQLNDAEIQIVPQQYVGLPENRYAMTDVFFPQAGIFVEINEPEHYYSDWKIQLDHHRNQSIAGRTGIQIMVVDCRESMQGIHQQIDRIVEAIRERVAESRQQGIFKRWRPNEARNPEYWKEKKRIHIEDDVIMSNIETICQLFDADFNKTKRGYFRKGAIPHPNLLECVIWWPSAFSRSGWQNICNEGGDLITESHQNPQRNQAHYHNTVKWPHKRIVFYFNKDILGFSGYYFMGIYEIDTNLSNEHEGLFWRRVSKEVVL
jgi:very-short-patch-repair endonuclease